MIRAQQLETAKTKQGKLVDAHNWGLCKLFQIEPI